MKKRILQPDPAKLRQARINADIPVLTMALRTGISERMVRMIELGYSRPYADQIAMWAEVCAVPMLELFTRAKSGAFSRRKNFNKVENNA
jgi:transcriptional regulator with XRE-family HTH domain